MKTDDLSDREEKMKVGVKHIALLQSYIEDGTKYHNVYFFKSPRCQIEYAGSIFSSAQH